MLTDPAAPDQRRALWEIYKQLYVEYVVKNPMNDRGGDPGAEWCNVELFRSTLDAFVQQLR